MPAESTAEAAAQQQYRQEQRQEYRQETRRALKAAAAAGDAPGTLQLGRALLALGKPAADTAFCASAFTELGDALLQLPNARRLKTGIVRSVTVEPILPALTVEAALQGFLLDLQVGGFGSFADDLLNPASELAQASPDLVLILLDLEDIAGQLPELCADGRGHGVEAAIADAAAALAGMLGSFRSRSSARILLQGFVLPESTSLGDVADANLAGSLPSAVASLNRKLAALCRTVSDCVFFDVDRLAARHGRAAWQDTRLFLASRLPVAAAAFPLYAQGLVRSFSTLFRAPRKVLCTDLDNTLWGGILGEDGPGGILTGAAFPGNSYRAYQRYIRQISKRGILLAAVSKNNHADVVEAFELRRADLALTLDDFVATRIGWNDKAQSLRELAEELSLGLDSFVFVDDNPVECEAIRQHLPEVAVVQVPVDAPWTLVPLLAAQPFFDAAHITEDDLHRATEYKAQAQRTALASTASTRDEFLASLAIVCTFLPALEAPLARSVQLLGKTNQFNLTTRRYSSTELEAFAALPGAQAVAIRVRDRFGDAGVVGIALARTEGDVCRIDSLLLSCRVIGRGIESALLAEVARRAAAAGARSLVGEYIPTRKNSLCAGFYPDHGFRQNTVFVPVTDQPGTLLFSLDLTLHMPGNPAWLTLEGSAPHEHLARPLVAS